MKLDRLEMLRGAAALYVVVHHFLEITDANIPHWLSFPFMQGQAAVILFFMLSGFVIRYSLRHENLDNVKAKKYLIKRIRRIYPIFIVAIFIPIIAWHLSDRSYYHAPTIIQVIGNLLNFQDLGRYPGVVIKPFLNNPLWSLSYEWFFYLYFILLIKTTKKKWLTIVTYSLAIGGIILLKFFPGKIALNLLYLPIWWAGFELAELYLSQKLNSKGVLIIALKLSLFISLYSLIILPSTKGDLLGFHPFFEIFHYGYALSFLILGLLWSKIGYKFFERIFGLFIYASPISYSIYVLHYAIAANIPQIFMNTEIIPWYIYTCGVLITIPICWLLERKLQPIINKMTSGLIYD